MKTVVWEVKDDFIQIGLQIGSDINVNIVVIDTENLDSLS